MYFPEITQVLQRYIAVKASAQPEAIDRGVAYGGSSALDDTPGAPKAEFGWCYIHATHAWTRGSR